MGIADRATPATVASYIVVVTAAIVVVATVAPALITAVQPSGPDQKQVAVISVRGSTNDANVNAVQDALREARQNESIAAVVLSIDSSGGPVDSSEEFYLAVNRTAREMPVVAYVEGVAASGGYYGIAPADEIIVKPSSTVGSVGVIVSAPLSLIEDAEQQGEALVRSGPDKAQVSRDQIRSDIETLQSAFVGTVMRHRGEDLTVSREEVENADVYLGATAVENGFADRIGDSATAIQRAAALSDDAHPSAHMSMPVIPRNGLQNCRNFLCTSSVSRKCSQPFKRSLVIADMWALGSCCQACTASAHDSSGSRAEPCWHTLIGHSPIITFLAHIWSH